MDMSTVKVLFALAATCGVPAKHADIPNAYVKAEKECELEVFLHVPQAMEIDIATIKNLGATRKKELSTELCKSLYMLKQAGRLWSQLLHKKLCDASFSVWETCVCTEKSTVITPL